MDLKLKTTYTIDIGNGHPHIAKFINNQVKEVTPLQDFIKKSPTINFSNSEISLISSSVGDDSLLENFPKEKMLSCESLIKNNHFLDMPIFYSKTLGVDRVVQSYFIWKNYSHEKFPIALVDVGTFTTIDIIRPEGEFGGPIIPGPQTYLDLFPEKGAKLPSLPSIYTGHYDLNVNNTEEAIYSGLHFLYQGLVEELKKAEISNIYLTGGSSSIIVQFLDNFKITIDSQLIHKSLNYISKVHQEFQNQQ